MARVRPYGETKYSNSTNFIALASGLRVGLCIHISETTVRIRPMLATPMITRIPAASMSSLLMALLLLPLAIAWAVLVLAAVIVYWAFPSRRPILIKIAMQELAPTALSNWPQKAAEPEL
jgi:hypothetical protein